MPISITRIKTDSTNYSRYDAQTRVITASAYFSAPAAGGETFTFDLVRLDGYGVVASVLSLPAVANQKAVRVTFDLSACHDPQYAFINRAKTGDYTVREHVTQVAAPRFSVTLVSLRRLRDDLCKGLPLLTGETVGVQDPPTNCTGVQIMQIDPSLLQGVYTLSFAAAGQTLSWDGGTPVAVGAGGPFTLIDKSGSWWVRVAVDDLALPTVNAADTLAVSEQRMTDADLVTEIVNAQRSLEDAMQVYIEPTQVTTQLLHDFVHAPPAGQPIVPSTNDFADVIKPPVYYLRPANFGTWITIQLPLRGIQQLEGLYGFINTSESVALPKEWWLWDEKSGMVQLVPSQSAAISWANYTGFFYSFLLAGYDNFPNFWHYKVTAGLRDLVGREANVLVALEYRAAINILRRAALHAKPGYTSESLGRDGISQTIGYSAGKGGVYKDIIDSYQEWLDKEEPQLKRARRGVKVRFL